MNFSYGHWNKPEEAHGYKREKLEQWRGLAKIKPEPEHRVPLSEQATIDKVSRGRRKLRLARFGLTSALTDLRGTRRPRGYRDGLADGECPAPHS